MLELRLGCVRSTQHLGRFPLVVGRCPLLHAENSWDEHTPSSNCVRAVRTGVTQTSFTGSSRSRVEDSVNLAQIPAQGGIQVQFSRER